MAADDSTRWELLKTPPRWDPERAERLREEYKAAGSQRHLQQVAERKRDREAARRLAKGYTENPTDYPWLKPEWVDPPVLPLRLRNRMP